MGHRGYSFEVRIKYVGHVNLVNAGRAIVRRSEVGLSRTPLFEVFFALAALAAAIYLGYVLIHYSNLDGYLDHIEPNIAASAWWFMGGHALFPKPDDWPIFIGYGPLLTFIHSSVFNFAGGSIAMSKLANSVVSVGSVLVMFAYARNRFGGHRACIGILLFVAVILIYAPISFWNRPDPFIVFLVALAVFTKGLSTEKWGNWAPHLIVGICIGLAVNLKVHAFIYFIPIAIDLCGWKGIRQMIIIGLISIAVFLLPFAHPQISIEANISIIFENLSAQKRFDTGLLIKALKYSMLFLAPGFLLVGLLVRGRHNIQAKDAIYFAALTLSTAFALFPSSNLGMGSYHLLPLLAISIDSFLRFLNGFDDTPRLQKGIMIFFPLLFLLISIPVQRRLTRNMDRITLENVAEEVVQVTQRLQNKSLQVGYGQSFEKYRFSYFKIIPMFTGQPITIDAQTMMEFNFIGIDLSHKLAADIEACKTRNWLIPKGEQPFTLKSYYTGKRLFGQTPQIFLHRYEKSESLKYFDLWTCKG
jgi:hypothetical protein